MRFPLTVLVAAAALAASLAAACHRNHANDEADQAAIDQAKKLVSEIDGARRQALGSARTTVRPSASPAPCPVTFDPIFARARTTEHADPLHPEDRTKKAWGGYDVPRYDPAANDLIAGMADDVCAIERVGIELADEAASKPGPLAFSLRSALRGVPRAWEVTDILTSRHETDYELVIDHEVLPKVLGKSFTPGSLEGRFYVWDNSKRAIVCMANVSVESSDALYVEYSGPRGTEEAGLDMQVRSGLVSDLREQAFLQARKGLVAVEGAAVSGAASGASASVTGSRAKVADERVLLEDAAPVAVSAAVVDLGAVPPADVALVRARIWALGDMGWGWPKPAQVARAIAAEAPGVAFWIALKSEGHVSAFLVGRGGHAVVLAPTSLTGLVAKGLARDEAEAERVVRALSPADASPVAGVKEVVDGKLITPPWPDYDTLRDGELVKGEPFKTFHKEGTYYLPEPLVAKISDRAAKLDTSRSVIVQRAYAKGRRAPGAGPRTTARRDPKAARTSVFLVLPLAMAMEIEREADEHDSSKSAILEPAVTDGLPATDP